MVLNEKENSASFSSIQKGIWLAISRIFTDTSTRPDARTVLRYPSPPSPQVSRLIPLSLVSRPFRTSFCYPILPSRPIHSLHFPPQTPVSTCTQARIPHRTGNATATKPATSGSGRQPLSLSAACGSLAAGWGIARPEIKSDQPLGLGRGEGPYFRGVDGDMIGLLVRESVAVD